MPTPSLIYNDMKRCIVVDETRQICTVEHISFHCCTKIRSIYHQAQYNRKLPKHWPDRSVCKTNNYSENSTLYFEEIRRTRVKVILQIVALHLRTAWCSQPVLKKGKRTYNGLVLPVHQHFIADQNVLKTVTACSILTINTRNTPSAA